MKMLFHLRMCLNSTLIARARTITRTLSVTPFILIETLESDRLIALSDDFYINWHESRLMSDVINNLIVVVSWSCKSDLWLNLFLISQAVLSTKDLK